MRRVCLAVAAAALLVPLPSHAQTTLEVDAGFYRFTIPAVGWEVTGASAGDGLLASSGGLFSFELFVHGRLSIWDYQLNSERFRVTINGIDLGLTSNTDCVNYTDPGCVWNYDPFDALASGVFTYGFYDLGPGMYEVSVVAERGDLLPGNGVIGVTSVAVPEPAGMLLLISGLVGIAAVRQRRWGGDDQFG